MVQQSRGLCISPEDLSWVPSNRFEFFTAAASNSCFKGTDTIFWPFAETCMHVPKHKDTHTNPYKGNMISFCFFF
uniref:Uncharacterized protein n=1 Tax=Mus musculus TaxID=10090 RepID=Q6R5D8_MOUSE|nr:unknown [Mus musculus]